MSGSRPYSTDLATEVVALTSLRAELIDAASWLLIWLLLLCCAR
jgi:hypothetical protein